MKRSIFLAAGLAALLNAGMLPSNVVSSGSLAQENGGAKTAIDAYSDGAGALLINQAADTKFDNSPMNKLVFKYGEEAKRNSVNLVQQVQTVSTTSSAQEKILAGSILAVVPPTCADVAMNWNAVTKLCEKGGISTYAATGTLGGYTISGSSISQYNYGLNKNGNTFCLSHSYGCGIYTFLRVDGTLDQSICPGGGGSACLYSAPGGFYAYNGGPAGVALKSGSSLNQSSIAAGIGIERVDANWFRAYNNGVSPGALIQWEPFYSTLTCPSGGTLSGSVCTLITSETAPGICSSGYSMVSNQCVKN